jgi:hypothetical protein
MGKKRWHVKTIHGLVLGSGVCQACDIA